MIGFILLTGAIIGLIMDAMKPTKTTKQFRQGGNDVTEVTFHGSGKTVVYKNGVRVK